MQDWPEPGNAVVVAIESVQLVQQLAARVAGQRLFVMFSFLPSLCSARQQQTRAMAVSQQPIAFDFCLVRVSALLLQLSFWIFRLTVQQGSRAHLRAWGIKTALMP